MNTTQRLVAALKEGEGQPETLPIFEKSREILAAWPRTSQRSSSERSMHR